MSFYLSVWSDGDRDKYKDGDGDKDRDGDRVGDGGKLYVKIYSVCLLLLKNQSYKISTLSFWVTKPKKN